MTRSYKVQYFETEGRDNLPAVIKCIKAFLRGLETQRFPLPKKIVFLTTQGEGPMLAYNQLQAEDVKVIAVTFPNGASELTSDGHIYTPHVSEKVRDFFSGVKIPIVTNRLPFDDIIGCGAHNQEMKLIRNVLGVFGSSTSLAIQAVLQAADAGYVEIGEQVIAATGDAAILVTATTTKNFLRQDHFGFAVNEIICKPRSFTISRKAPASSKPLTLEGENQTQPKKIEP